MTIFVTSVNVTLGLITEASIAEFLPTICLKFPNAPELQNVDSLSLSGNSDLLAGKVWIPQAVCAPNVPQKIETQLI